MTCLLCFRSHMPLSRDHRDTRRLHATPAAITTFTATTTFTACAACKM